jgi:mRNA-degrading endonuclease RelE of RelBE toxin-antitoxin system
MPYSLDILPDALEQIRKLPKKIKGQIGKKIDRLALDPFPPTCSQLEGKSNDGIYRITSGDYRILYQVTRNKVRVVKVGNRKDVYRNL